MNFYYKTAESCAKDLSEVAEDVVGNGVGQVVNKVLEGPLTGDRCLGSIAEHGKHSQAAVLDLLGLEDLHLSLGGTQVEHVEELATWGRRSEIAID